MTTRGHQEPTLKLLTQIRKNKGISEPSLLKEAVEKSIGFLSAAVVYNNYTDLENISVLATLAGFAGMGNKEPSPEQLQYGLFLIGEIASKIAELQNSKISL